MDEAASCDCLAFIYNGKLMAVDSPENLMMKEGTNSLEDVFIRYVERATGRRIESSFEELKFITGGEDEAL
jgi:ABC-2 type transport system ATP-binding protein